MVAFVAMAAVCLRVWVSWQWAHRAPPQIFTLADGERFRFAGVSYGTNPVPPGFEAHLVSWLPARLADFAKKYVGTRISQRHAGQTFVEPQLMVWFEHLGTNSALLAGAAINAARLADQDGVEAGVGDPLVLLSSVHWSWVSFPAVPRRSRVLQCDVYSATGPVAQISFPNPLHARFPQWQPEALPAVKHAGDLEIRLDEVLNGIHVSGTNFFGADGSRGALYQTLAKGRDVFTVFGVSLAVPKESGESWVLQGAELSDATGNVLRSSLPGLDMAGIRTEAPARTKFNATLRGTLWPDEAAWRIRLEIKRSSGFGTQPVQTTRVVGVSGGSRRSQNEGNGAKTGLGELKQGRSFALLRVANLHSWATRATRGNANGGVDNGIPHAPRWRMAKPALGRGLGALLGGSPPAGGPLNTASPAPHPFSPAPNADAGERVQRVALSRIRPCSFQPRKRFSEEALRELADSIKEQGIVQPLIVRNRGEYFELIAGERRWRASQLLGLAEVPVIVREADDRAVLELALIENLQRENLNPIEEAHGYSQLIEQFQLKQEEVATKVGKSRAVVANALRLLKLVPVIQDAIRDGLLSVGHAKVILGLGNDKQQKVAAERVIKDGLNVRQTEAFVARLQTRGSSPKAGSITPLANDANVTDVENRLRERFGTKVRLKYAQGKGSVEIAFFNDDDLERILQIVGVKVD